MDMVNGCVFDLERLGVPVRLRYRGWLFIYVISLQLALDQQEIAAKSSEETIYVNI